MHWLRRYVLLFTVYSVFGFEVYFLFSAEEGKGFVYLCLGLVYFSSLGICVCGYFPFRWSICLFWVISSFLHNTFHTPH